MKTMKIFEPAMCCATGLCGVGVDRELLRIFTVLDTLKTQGVDVERFNLSNAPMEFVKDAAINAFLHDRGADALPAILLDGEIALTGRYPTNEELAEWLELPADMLKKTAVKDRKRGGCNCKGGCC